MFQSRAPTNKQHLTLDLRLSFFKALQVRIFFRAFLRTV